MRWLVASPLLAIGLLAAATNHVMAGGRHRMERGETLEHVARAHGCDVELVKRINNLDTVLVRAGTIVTIPDCTVRTRARVRDLPAGDDDERARRALEVIDGRPQERPRITAARTVHERVSRVDDGRSSQSLGQPWNGRLTGGKAFPDGDGYWLRRPEKAFGAAHVVEHVRRAIAEVRKTYSDVHTLAIGDLSAEHGGQLGRHVSHQTGLDVDIGFYFTHKPEVYPQQFVSANGDLDLEATWALIEAFANTARADGGVQLIFLDHGVQARLYRWARSDGISADKLSAILQYPRSADAQAGIVRHWPSHSDHIHVRFKPR
ncbi:MAG: penicillin-insensitive murein endopeptidase [Deltaproteobacteria bacterium]|nr:penicillin-insensitive murein endopeptidase [Deltaproteobacteria bacterium]